MNERDEIHDKSEKWRGCFPRNVDCLLTDLVDYNLDRWLNTGTFGEVEVRRTGFTKNQQNWVQELATQLSHEP